MDPLSAIASVAGIATAAGEVAKILGPYITASSDAPKIAAQISSEALATQTILSALEQLASNFSAGNAKYASLIEVDQLVAVLTDGVLIFSDLEAVLQTLPPAEPMSPGGRLWSPMQWVRKKGSLTALFTRLQAFKLSVNCILSILQSDSQARAESSQQHLLSAVETLLEGNDNLANRMMGMETAIDAMSQRRSTTPFTSRTDSAVPPPAIPRRSSLFEFGFEHDLKASRVYRRAKRDTMDFSVRSSVARTHAWSIFSGISLSNISEISVLALPLYADDIANPQHYNFGYEILQPKALLSPTVYTKSIYHECVELQLQLSQLEWFDALHQKEAQVAEDRNPLQVLIAIFQRGTSLLMLFNQLDKSQIKKWETLIDSPQSSTVAGLATIEFVQACVNCLEFQPPDCFTVTDLMGPDSTGHIKVIRLVRLLAARLTKSGVIQAVVFEPTPDIFTTDPSPAGLAVDDFLRDERFYLKRLESLLEAADQITPCNTLPVDTLKQVFAPVGPLVDAQREFLIKAEMLATKPCLLQDWHLAFWKWSQQSSSCYAALVTAEKESKETIRAALSSTENHNSERRALLGESLASLGLPSQRLEKYEAFLKELSKHGLHEAGDIELAMARLQQVKEDVDDAAVSQELQKTAIVFSAGLDLEGRAAVGKLGELLMFDHVDITTPEGDPVEQSHLFLYQKGILQAKESLPNIPRRGILRSRKPFPQDCPKTQLSIAQIIRAEKIGYVHTPQGQEPKVFKIGWWTGMEEEAGLEAAISSFRQVTIIHFSPMSSSLTGPEKLIQSYSVDEYGPSIKDPYRKLCVIDDEVALLDVLDTAGHEEYPAVREQHMRTGDGFLLVYNVASRQNFEEILFLQLRILRMYDKDYFPMVLVGNEFSEKSEREVSRQEGEALARAMGCEFIEVDAKSGVNVDKAFYDLVREIRRYFSGHDKASNINQGQDSFG
ncbi:hypothetical protein ACJZ2D_015177 [Fusarium nematophilum]